MTIKKKRITLIIPILLALLLLFGCGRSVPNDSQEGPDAAVPTESSQNDSASGQDTDTPDGLPEISVGSFTTEDLNGNTVTEKIFAEKEYTMINVWGTYCGPCINEMPELEELHQNMPDNMQIIGMVCDLPYEIQPAETLDLANEIVKTTGVTYPSLMVYQDAYWFLDTTNVVPTTYFVDSEGNLASDIIYGADIDAYRAAIEKLGK